MVVPADVRPRQEVLHRLRSRLVNWLRLEFVLSKLLHSLNIKIRRPIPNRLRIIRLLLFFLIMIEVVANSDELFTELLSAFLHLLFIQMPCICLLLRFDLAIEFGPHARLQNFVDFFGHFNHELRFIFAGFPLMYEEVRTHGQNLLEL